MAQPTSPACRRVAPVAAGSLAVVGLLLLVLAVPAVWLHRQLLDTDRYLATVAPLGADPIVQDEVADRVTAAIDERLDLSRRLKSALPPIARPLAGPAGKGTRQIVAQVTNRYTHSPEFERLWVTLNRTAHRQIVAILTGRPAVGGGIDTDPGGRVWLDLGPVIEQVTRELAAAGVPAAGSLPTISLKIDIGRVAAADRARTLGRWLDRTAAWLPPLAAACLLASIALARRRRRTILAIGLGAVAAMLGLLIALMAARHAVLAKIPPQAFSPAIGGRIFDQLSTGLRDNVRHLALLGGLAAAAAITAPPTSAWIRSHLGSATRKARANRSRQGRSQ